MTPYRVLGPLGLEYDGRAVLIGSALQRRLLAVLLVHAGAVVSADRLIDIMWGDRPPAAARQGLWTCVARLRHALQDPTGPTPGEILVTRRRATCWRWSLSRSTRACSSGCSPTHPLSKRTGHGGRRRSWTRR